MVSRSGWRRSLQCTSDQAAISARENQSGAELRANRGGARKAWSALRRHQRRIFRQVRAEVISRAALLIEGGEAHPFDADEQRPTLEAS